MHLGEIGGVTAAEMESWQLMHLAEMDRGVTADAFWLHCWGDKILPVFSVINFKLINVPLIKQLIAFLKVCSKE